MPATDRKDGEAPTLAPRYEFRVWGDDLGDLCARLQAKGEFQEKMTGDESYILLRENSCFNPKIRNQALDVKRLVKRLGRLELWRPHLRLEFPSSGGRIREEVCPILDVDSQIVSHPTYDADAFADRIVKRCPHLRLVPVNKTRCRFAVDQCLTEFTEVVVGQMRIETVAVESETVAAVRRCIASLDFAGRRNLNYQRALRLILDSEGGDSDRFKR